MAKWVRNFAAGVSLLVAPLFFCFALPALTVEMPSAPAVTLGRTLIVYFSYRGNTRYLARRLGDNLDADLLEITPDEPYRDATVNRTAKRQLEENYLPPVGHAAPPDFSGYDLVMIGSPVWWGHVPMPMASFLEKADFGGARVAFFCTHRGIKGEVFSAFARRARNATLLPPMDFFSPLTTEERGLDGQIASWLARLG